MSPSLKPSESKKPKPLEGQVFIKDDSEKVEYHLFPVKALEKVTRVLMYGAKKYAPDNWRNCTNDARYYNAALRHLYAWRSGEKTDPESGMPHLWHAACNLIFLVELE